MPTLHGHAGGPPLDPEIAPSVQALADAIEDELDRLGLQKVHIAGNSLGGWIGIELARRGRARSLVLLSPAGAWHSHRGIELRATAIRLSVGALGALFAPGRRHRRQRASAMGAVGRASSTSPVACHLRILATFIQASGQAPVVVPLLRELPLRQVDPLPADRDYPVRLVWADRDLVLPFDRFGTRCSNGYPGRS